MQVAAISDTKSRGHARMHLVQRDERVDAGGGRDQVREGGDEARHLIERIGGPGEEEERHRGRCQDVGCPLGAIEHAADEQPYSMTLADVVITGRFKLRVAPAINSLARTA